MKKNKIEQFNCRIDPDLKEELKYLNGHGVDVPEMARKALREAAKRAKKHLEEQAS